MIIINLMAQSIDGKIASYPEEPTADRLTSGLTNPWDQEILQKEVENADAVILGAQSLRVEGSLPELKRNPPWFIFTRNGLDPLLHFWRQRNIQRTLLSPLPLAEVPDPSVSNLVYDHPDQAIPTLMKELKRHKAKRVLLLGGNQINSIFYQQNLVDEIKLTLSPLIVGTKGVSFADPFLAKAMRFHLIALNKEGDYLSLHYRKELNTLSKKEG